MKLLKINDKKAEFSTDGENFKTIIDISKEDIASILNTIYNRDDYEIDQFSEDTLIDNDVERLIYKNLYAQITGFIQNKAILTAEINNEFKDVIEKYN